MRPPYLTRLCLLAALMLPALQALAADAPSAAPAPDPAAILSELKAGNTRFAAGSATHPNDSVARRERLVYGQHPKAAVLGCADSRVPPELVFDEGLGDLFVVRVAGNVVSPLDVGSLEYAVEHLGVNVVVVLGHHACGAVKATADGGAAEGNLGALVKEIAPAVAEAKAKPGREGLVNDAVHVNARRTAAALVKRSPLLARAIEEKKLRIVVGVYDFASGLVEWE